MTRAVVAHGGPLALRPDLPLRIACTTLATLAATLLVASTAHAQPARPAATATPTPSEAEVRFQRGLELFNVRNYEGALAEFQRSYELSGMAGLLYNLARTYQALGRYPEAARAIERYLREASDLSADRRAEVEGMLTQTRSFIARIDLRIEPADAHVAVTLDGDAVQDPLRAEGLAVGPGRHAIEATGEGWQSVSASVVLASGDRREVRLTLRPTASETRIIELRRIGAGGGARLVFASTPTGATARIDGHEATLPAADVAPGHHELEVSAPGHETWRGSVEIVQGATRTITPHLASTRGLSPTLFYAGASATGLFLVAGIVTGVLTESTHDDYALRFRDEYNSPDVVALRDRGETLRLLSNVSFGLAAAAGVATAVLFTQTRFRRTSTAEISLAPTPDGAAARLRVTF
jgi:PEGA domain